jgi:hypothetical protein
MSVFTLLGTSEARWTRSSLEQRGVKLWGAGVIGTTREEYSKEQGSAQEEKRMHRRGKHNGVQRCNEGYAQVT